MVLLAIIAVAGCSDDPTITITNRSGQPLDNVVVSGSGFSASIGAMSPVRNERLRLILAVNLGFA
jgi:hypothetical protein